MQSLRAKPIDIKHLLLSSLGFLAVYCGDLAVNSSSLAVSRSYIDVRELAHPAPEQKSFQPVCNLSEDKKLHSLKRCDHSQEKYPELNGATGVS